MAEAGVGPDLFADLTDRQIAEIYGHDRDDGGRLSEPEIPQEDTLAARLMAAEQMAMHFSLSQEDREIMYAKVKEEWDAEHPQREGG